MPLKDLTNTPPRQQLRAKQLHPANKVVWSTICPKLMTPAAEMVRHTRPEPPSTAGLRAKPPPPLSDGSSSLGDDIVISSPDEEAMSQGRTSKSLSFEGSGEHEEVSPANDTPNPPPKPSGVHFAAEPSKRAADNASRSIMRGISTPGIDARTQILVLEARLKDEQRRARESDARADSLRRQNATLLQQRSEDLQQHKEDHPVFGELLSDMGFKRIYLASARTLVHSVPIWSKQRPCNEGRVQEIVRAKRAAPRFMGAIMCFEFRGVETASVACAQPRGIFDGQHRARACAQLLTSEAFSIEDDAAPESWETREGGGGDSGGSGGGGSGGSGGGAFSRLVEATNDGHDDFPVVVEVYPVSSEAEAKALYLEVNKGESVKEIDLPDAIAPERKGHIDWASEALRTRFSDMFKPSERCRVPHMHKDTLRNKLFHHPTTERVGSGQELLQMLLKVNASLGSRPKGSWPAKVQPSAIEKAKQHKFFLGLDSEYGFLDAL